MALAGSTPRFVFRGCSPEERDPRQTGLRARTPEVPTPVRDAIENGKGPSCFVHASRSAVTAIYYATSGTNFLDGVVVKIDLGHEALIGKVIDVSTQDGARLQGLTVENKGYTFAVMHREILVNCAVPASAIVGIFRVRLPTSFGPFNSVQDFLDEFSRNMDRKPAEDAIVTQWYGVDAFYVDEQADRYHFSNRCFYCEPRAEGVPGEAPQKALRACKMCLMRGASEFLLQEPPQQQPPQQAQPQTRTYYITRTGKKFHVRADCDGLRNAARILSTNERHPLNLQGKRLSPCNLCAR
ncbi:unnamed protein product [Prorocentrum cordatum]|uniref:Uncharacterized protein n=1 Tax=Prorocentrum cordatum TaxID=2364126 RepID=A0ABN9TUM4_9DINO|nr:unnamed protein product [Polarella glacialis]